MNPKWPLFLLTDGSSTPSGGSGGAPSASPPAPAGNTSGASAPEPHSPIPDSPAEPAPTSDAFAGMENEDFDLVELPLEDDSQVGEAGEQQPVATPPATPKQPATAAQPAAPQAAPAKPEAAKQDAPQAPRSALDQAIEGFRTNHKELSTWASTNLFALTKEESDLLETDAVTAIPLLMGKVYSQALQATTNLIKNFVPNMVSEGVQTTTARTAKATEALQEFYAANSHLNPQQHGALVDKWARAFRAANPSASRQEAIKFVGNAVSTEAGLAPAAAGANGRAPRPAPFAPARPGTRVQQPSQPHDPYEGMDMEFDQ
jgi:hypothetical protein